MSTKSNVSLLSVYLPKLSWSVNDCCFEITLFPGLSVLKKVRPGKECDYVYALAKRFSFDCWCEDIKELVRNHLGLHPEAQFLTESPFYTWDNNANEVIFQMPIQPYTDEDLQNEFGYDDTYIDMNLNLSIEW